MTIFQQYAGYYDLLYGDKDYDGEAAFVADIIHRQLPHAKSILEFGCGTGLHALALAKKGYSVVGVDLSRDMIAQAKKRHSKASIPSGTFVSFEQADIRSLRLAQKFDAVISLFHVMSYQTATLDVEATMIVAGKHLKPNGVFIFDYWYGPAVIKNPPTVRVKCIENEAIRVTRMAKPQMLHGEHIVNVGYEIRIEDRVSGSVKQVRENHSMRYFFEPELCQLLNSVGFEPVRFGQWLTSKPPSDHTWSVYAVARHITTECETHNDDASLVS